MQGKISKILEFLLNFAPKINVERFGCLQPHKKMLKNFFIRLGF